MSDNTYGDFLSEADTLRKILIDKIDIERIIKANYLDLGIYKDT